MTSFTNNKSVRSLVRSSLKRIGLYPLFTYVRKRTIKLVTVPMDKIVGKESTFSNLQGFSAKPIDHFPPCKFFKQYLTDPDAAYTAFSNWLRMCLVDMKAWDIPRSEGGWKESSLVELIYQMHREEQGDDAANFENIDLLVVDRAIDQTVRYYFDLCDSVKQGFVSSQFPPIRCYAKNGNYVLKDGHHRTSILRALGAKDVKVQMVSEDWYKA